MVRVADWQESEPGGREVKEQGPPDRDAHAYAREHTDTAFVVRPHYYAGQTSGPFEEKPTCRP